MIAIGDRIEKKKKTFFFILFFFSIRLYLFDPVGGLDRVRPSWIEKVRPAISCTWVPARTSGEHPQIDLGEGLDTF